MPTRNPRLRPIDHEVAPYFLKSGHHGPSTMIVVKGRTLDGGWGSQDWISCYRFEGAPMDVYVLATHRMGYVSLARFDLRSGGEQVTGLPYHGERETWNVITPDVDVFLDDSESIEQHLGPKGLDYSDPTMVRRLADCLDY